MDGQHLLKATGGTGPGLSMARIDGQRLRVCLAAVHSLHHNGLGLGGWPSKHGTRRPGLRCGAVLPDVVLDWVRLIARPDSLLGRIRG